MYKNILIPIAPDHSADHAAAMEVAQALLTSGGQITALTVMEDIPAYVADQLPQGQLEKTRTMISDQLTTDFRDTKGVTTKVVLGHSATTILEQAETLGSDCIVIASHRPGLADYFLGSTAGRVVRHAQCAVHVIR